MLLYATATLCVVLLIACFKLTRALRQEKAGNDADHKRWVARTEELEVEAHQATDALHTFKQAAIATLYAMADEVERATGHSREAAAFSSLARSVHQASSPWDVVLEETVHQLSDVGIAAGPRPLHLGQALEMAVELDTRSRPSEQGLYKVTRLCFIDEFGSDQARWLAQTMALMQRLCGDDAAAARRKLRDVIDVWERTDVRVLKHCIQAEGIVTSAHSS